MKSKAPLLLMEQMVMLLVFALAAALCLQAFVKSDGLSRRSEARDRAMTLGCGRVIFLGATGGRLDHMLANIHTLYGCMEKSRQKRFN